MNRKILKKYLWRDRPRLCDICGEPMRVCDMHESIVRRGVAQGWPLKRRSDIFVPENCHLLHPKCHSDAHANPELMVAIQMLRYGREKIQEWIDSLPFRATFYWDRGLGMRDAYELVEAHTPWILEEL